MTEDKDLLDGFNAGYLIEKHRPALSQKLVAVVDGVEVPFMEGFVAGAKEYVKEKTQIKTISKLREASKGRGIPNPVKDKNRGRDGKDLEIDR